jgi:heme exporter protein D
MSDFWNMGGYAGFVWPAYGISLLGLGGAMTWTWRSWRIAKARLAALEKK